MRQWSNDVVYFADSQHLAPGERQQLAARAIGIVDEPVARLTIANDRLTGVELGSGRVVSRTAVFVRPQLVAHDELLTVLGCATHPNGWVVTDPAGRTSVAGVWTAGNVTNPRAQDPRPSPPQNLNLFPDPFSAPSRPAAPVRQGDGLLDDSAHGD